MLRMHQLAGLLVITAITVGIFTLASAEPPASPAQEKIRAALEGDFKETGDGFLNDVIGVIHQRGSVLDGSSLDPANSDAAPIGDAESNSISSKAHAAEQLLRASRLLEKVGSADKDRKLLVHRMRAEAVKLLTE